VPWRRRKETPLPQSVSIRGVHNSAIALGSGNYQIQGSTVESGATAARLDEALTMLRSFVEAQAGPQRESALGQVDQFEHALRSEPPDVTRLGKVRDWFMVHLPPIAPAIAEVVARPTADTVIRAVGQVVQAEAARRSSQDRPAPEG
jgi:hypothetical protein